MIHLSLFLIPLGLFIIIGHYMHARRKVQVKELLDTLDGAHRYLSPGLHALYSELESSSVPHHGLYWVSALSFILSCMSFPTLILWTLCFGGYSFWMHNQREFELQLSNYWNYFGLQDVHNFFSSKLYALFPSIDYAKRFEDNK